MSCETLELLLSNHAVRLVANVHGPGAKLSDSVDLADSLAYMLEVPVESAVFLVALPRNKQVASLSAFALPAMASWWCQQVVPNALDMSAVGTARR